MIELIDIFIKCKQNQADVDMLYNKFCKALTNEMELP